MAKNVFVAAFILGTMVAFESQASLKIYKLVSAEGNLISSRTKGRLGGNKALKIYGRLDCPSALKWLAKGHYSKNRVFFASEADAIAAGYRPCAICQPEAYQKWKKGKSR